MEKVPIKYFHKITSFLHHLARNSFQSSFATPDNPNQVDIRPVQMAAGFFLEREECIFQRGLPVAHCPLIVGHHNFAQVNLEAQQQNALHIFVRVRVQKPFLEFIHFFVQQPGKKFYTAIAGIVDDAECGFLWKTFVVNCAGNFILLVKLLSKSIASYIIRFPRM